jgi:very-short-patch-repair endonuclease
MKKNGALRSLHFHNVKRLEGELFDFVCIDSNLVLDIQKREAVIKSLGIVLNFFSRFVQ